MKYYRITNAIEGVGRKFPQVKTAVGNYDVRSESFIGNSKFYFKKVNIDPEIPEPLLWDSAKLTDLLSSSHMGINKGLIASDKLKSIIEKAQPEHIQFFRTKVHHKGNTFKYWYLHPCGNNNDLIDFTRSEIWERSSLKKIKQVNFPDEVSFRRAQSNPGYPINYVVEHYVLKDNLPDFFILVSLNIAFGYFVSEAVRRQIEDAECTGILFLELNESYP